jgi:catechol 2,3-dioxygenase-like lactoylglutathione lyase family enzyme
MFQIELYVADVEDGVRLFTSVFGLEVIENKPGFRQLRHHMDNYDIMLFTPGGGPEDQSHWPLPKNGEGGVGIEIVLQPADAAGARDALGKFGAQPSELKRAPWGTLEFTFRMKEGYLVRVKEVG